MAERIRSVKITVEIETNKQTIHDQFELGEDETANELLERVKAVFEVRLQSITG